MAKKAKDITLNLNIDGKSATVTIKNVDQLVARVKKQTFGVGVNIAKWGTIVAGVNQGVALLQRGFHAISTAIKPFTEFEVGMRNVNSIIGETEQVIGNLGNEVLMIQKELGVTNKDLTNALYQTVSAGVSAGNSIEFLTIATKSAKAGLAGVEVAVDGLTTVVNAWHLEQKDVNKVADIMFETVKRGKTTFDQISGSIANVASLAAASGISFEEISAAIATMTKQGVPTEQAMTRIQRSIIGMNEVLGDGWADTMTYQEGLIEIEKRAGGSQNKLKELMGRVEGVNAVLSLTGENSKMAAEDLEAMNNSFGSMEAAFREQTKSLQFDIDQLGETIQVLVIKAVERFAPALSGIFGNVTVAIDDLIDLISVDLSDRMEEQRIEFNALIELIKDHNIHQDVRKRAVEELNISYKDYLGNLDIENASLQEINTWQREVNKAMIEKIEIQAAEELYAEVIKKQSDEMKNLFKLRMAYNKAEQQGALDNIVLVGGSIQTVGQIGNAMITKSLGNLEEYKKEFKDLMEFAEKEGIKLTGLLTTPTVPPVIPPGGTPPGGTPPGGEKIKPAFEPPLIFSQDVLDEQTKMFEETMEDLEEIYNQDLETWMEINQMKWDLMDEEKARKEMDLFEEQMMYSSREELLNHLVNQELAAGNTLNKLRDAQTKDQFEQLKKEHQVQQQKIKLIEGEIKARDDATKRMIDAGRWQYDANVAFGRQLENIVRDRIKQLIAEAVATQLAKAISSIPFPFNIIAAPAAGLAVQALMEKLIPSFEVGGLVSGKRHSQGGELVNMEGGEFIVNRESTRKNIEILEAINAGKSLNIKSMGDGFGGIINAINYQTKRLEEIERVVRLDPAHLDEQYENYQNQVIERF